MLKIFYIKKDMDSMTNQMKYSYYIIFSYASICCRKYIWAKSWNHILKKVVDNTAKIFAVQSQPIEHTLDVFQSNFLLFFLLEKEARISIINLFLPWLMLPKCICNEFMKLCSTSASLDFQNQPKKYVNNLNLG